MILGLFMPKNKQKNTAANLAFSVYRAKAPSIWLKYAKKYTF